MSSDLPGKNRIVFIAAERLWRPTVTSCTSTAQGVSPTFLDVFVLIRNKKLSTGKNSRREMQRVCFRQALISHSPERLVLSIHFTVG